LLQRVEHLVLVAGTHRHADGCSTATQPLGEGLGAVPQPLELLLVAPDPLLAVACSLDHAEELGHPGRVEAAGQPVRREPVRPLGCGCVALLAGSTDGCLVGPPPLLGDGGCSLLVVARPLERFRSTDRLGGGFPAGGDLGDIRS
jgi:hypothetical protein